MRKDILKTVRMKVFVCIFAALPAFFSPWFTALPSAEDRALQTIDFSDSGWLDAYMKEAAGVYGMDFVQDSAFSFGQDTGNILYIYASMNSVEELRAFYREQLKAAEHGRNDETAMHLSADLPQGSLEIANIFSQVCRLIHLQLSLTPDEAARIREQLLLSFPEAELNSIEELKEILSRDRYGIYVRYLYDDMNAFLSKGKPVFSCAFPGTDTEFEALAEALCSRFSHNACDSEDGTWYFDAGDGILGVSPVQTAGGQALISLLYQEK